MSASFQLPKPEQLVDLVGTSAAVQLAMNGAFDDKIMELKAAQAALAAAQSIATTVEQAQKVKADADAYAAKTKEECLALVAKAVNIGDQTKSRETLVAGREQAVSGRETAADARQRDQDEREQAIFNTQNARSAELLSRETALEQDEASYTSRKAQLDADIRAFNQRLEALKA